MLPLEGITVVAIEQAVAAPLATRLLADLGARVIKVERPPEGDFARAYDSTVNGMSSHFVWVNRSKESLSLDLKRPEGALVLQRLLAKADVFIQNLAPGAAERLGFGKESLKAAHPRLIICNISGYGASGSQGNRKAYDLLIQSETGLMSITGTEETPSKVGIAIADIAGAMYAYSGILTALLVRSRTNRGTVVEVSLLDALGEWMGYPINFTAYGGEAPRRTGASHAAIAPYGPYATRDNQAIYVAVQNAREWARFCDVVLERPGIGRDSRFESNSGRVEHRRALDEIILGIFRTLSLEEVIQRLERAQIANARMNSVQEFLQSVPRDRWRHVDSPAGSVRVLAPPRILEGVEPVMGAIPAVGQHNEAILRELGLDIEILAASKPRSGVEGS